MSLKFALVCAVFVILVVFEEGFAGVNTLGWVRKLAGIIISVSLTMLDIIRANKMEQHMKKYQQSQNRNISKLEEIHFWPGGAQTGAYGESLGGLVQAERGNHNQIA